MKHSIDPNKRNPDRTICELLRQSWRIADEMNNQELKDLIEEAHDYAKRMNKKLREYKEDWDAGWWQKNSQKN